MDDFDIGNGKSILSDSGMIASADGMRARDPWEMETKQRANMPQGNLILRRDQDDCLAYHLIGKNFAGSFYIATISFDRLGDAFGPRIKQLAMLIARGESMPIEISARHPSDEPDSEQVKSQAGR